MTSKKLYIKTYGCQMNVYDSDRIIALFEPLGYTTCDSYEEADLAILNTCHIREKATEKVYSELGRMNQAKKALAKEGKRMIIAVAGCVGQAEGQEIFRRASYVEIVVGPQSYQKLPDLVQSIYRNEEQHIAALEFEEDVKFDQLADVTSNIKGTAFLSIQEGCDKFCTFCCVPYTRGAEFSRPADAVYKEALHYIANGAKEIVLLGQNVNAYHGLGPQGDTWSLTKLLEYLAPIPGLKRLRYTTSHPRDMSEELIEAHGKIDVLMPYLHLPIQSGSNTILRRMNRKHTAEHYLGIIEKLRAVNPDIQLSSDFIVGFPSETDEDFEATLALVRAVKFDQAYSFSYSPRPGTPAADRQDQVAQEIKVERLKILQALLREQQEESLKRMIGSTQQVLFERPGKYPGQLMGRTPHMQAVNVMADASLLHQIAEVEIVQAYNNCLEGNIRTKQAA